VCRRHSSPGGAVLTNGLVRFKSKVLNSRYGVYNPIPGSPSVSGGVDIRIIRIPHNPVDAACALKQARP